VTSNITTMLAAAKAKQGTVAPAPAPSAKPTLVWDNIDPTELPDDVQALYYAIGKARSAFEGAMTAMLEPEPHLRLVFSYKRGLAAALAPVAAPSAGLAQLVARVNAASKAK
jgi:hypothetical protein